MSIPVRDRSEIGLDPADAAILGLPAVSSDADLAGTDDFVTVARRSFPVLFEHDAISEAGIGRQPFLRRVAQHLLDIVAEESCSARLRAGIKHRLPDDAGDVRDYLLKVPAFGLGQLGQALALALGTYASPSDN